MKKTVTERGKRFFWSEGKEGAFSKTLGLRTVKERGEHFLFN